MSSLLCTHSLEKSKVTELGTRDSRPQTASEYLNGEKEKDDDGGGGGDNEFFFPTHLQSVSAPIGC